MNYKAIIVDDEQACICQLTADLGLFPEIEIIGTFTSSVKAKEAIEKQKPQIIFLDVEMPEINGFELLQEIRPFVSPQTYIVFYSAFHQYTLDALRASAFDFLQKPYLQEELSFIISRIQEKQQKKEINFEQSLNRLAPGDRKLAFQTNSGLLILKPAEILCFEYINDMRCWRMMLTNRTTYKLRNSLKSESILQINHSFCQISQEKIVNIDYLSSIENLTYICSFYPPFTDLKFIVSRRYYPQIKERLNII